MGTSAVVQRAFLESAYPDESPESLFKVASRRRLFGVPASKEYLEDPATRRAIQLIRAQVFGQEDTPEMRHIGLNWEIDEKTERESFAELMAKQHNITADEFIRQFHGDAAATDMDVMVVKDKKKKKKKRSKKTKLFQKKRKDAEPDDAETTNPDEEEPLRRTRRRGNPAIPQ